ncbi:MAG TPA: PHP domain-containing protein [Lachnospiraceae bacterium]|nr:PHP domain-containing protein [Lachnospiraceae bacterium]
MTDARTVDLHVHSDKSDGSFSPSALVEMAAGKGLCAFALTDHDTTAGLKEAVAAGKKRGIEVIPGIEFSTEYQGKDIHILGLFIDEDAPAFQEHLHRFVESRIERNRKMCGRLQEDGIDISYEKLLEAFPGSVITRSHYSRYLYEHGYVRSMPEAFDRYLGDHTKYYLPREKISPADAVSLILEVKGIPVLAHPTLYHMGQDELKKLVRTLKNAGLTGIEAIYSTYSAGEERQMRRLAAQFDLLISGGSDFHGKSKPKLEMGTGYGKLFIPEDILLALKDKRKELFHV